jgi:hypothetical protein
MELGQFLMGSWKSSDDADLKFKVKKCISQCDVYFFWLEFLA